jgi:hypothetical protein
MVPGIGLAIKAIVVLRKVGVFVPMVPTVLGQ